MPIEQSGQNIDNFDIAATSLAAGVTFTATTSATGNIVATLGPFNAQGGDYYVDMFAPSITKGTTNADLELWVDGVFNQTISGHLAANVAIPGLFTRNRVSLTPGVHTLTVRGFVDAGTGTLGGGAGTTGNSPNARLVVRPC